MLHYNDQHYSFFYSKKTKRNSKPSDRGTLTLGRCMTWRILLHSSHLLQAHMHRLGRPMVGPYNCRFYSYSIHGVIKHDKINNSPRGNTAWRVKYDPVWRHSQCTRNESHHGRSRTALSAAFCFVISSFPDGVLVCCVQRVPTVDCKAGGWLLESYILATPKVISGCVPTCDSTHSWRLNSASLLGHQSAGTMTQPHYPDNELTSPCHTLVMLST